VAELSAPAFYAAEEFGGFKILEKCQDFLEWGLKMMDALEKEPDGSCP